MQVFAPPQNAHRTKEDYVYDTLRTAIVRCELGPGQRLVIDRIKSDLKVSAIPIRSALQRLSTEGLVEIIPHTGAIVSQISLDTVTEIFLLLESLESAAVSVVVTNVSADKIEDFKQLLARMERALAAQNAELWYDLNNQFHLEFARLTGMKMLIRFTQRALDSRDRLRRFLQESFIGPRMAEAHAEHYQMVKLLEDRDLVALKTVVRQHNNKAKQAYQQLIESQQSQ